MAEHVSPAQDPGNLPIVAAVDGSEISHQAVAWAATEAELRHCPLHLITSYALPVGRGTRTSLSAAEQAELREGAERMLTEATRIARKFIADDIVITTELCLDPITPALIDRSQHLRMVVVGNRGRRGISKAVAGSVSAALSRHAHCPVAIVHGDAQGGPSAAQKQVVVGVDGTSNSLPAIELAFEEAAQRRVGVRAVRAWSDSSGFDLPVVGWDRIRQTEELLLDSELDEFSERFPEVPVELVVVRDTPERALLEHTADAQLLVVGSHGRGGFAGLVVGSVSIALLHLAECPVIVVRQS
ncbi:universal stress protein [Nocardia sp. NPDC006630]|uniref:universal stress protein n=1 Tax=Nocardia sp. NPDC006630 TaxID=3157181 RepID=UPI0033ABAAFE